MEHKFGKNYSEASISNRYEIISLAQSDKSNINEQNDQYLGSSLLR